MCIRDSNPNGIPIGSAVFAQLTIECPYTLQWDAHSPPQNLPLPIGGSGPPSNTWLPGPTQILNSNGNSIGAAVFAGLTNVTDRLTDHATRSVRIGRICVRSTAMWPNNTYTKMNLSTVKWAQWDKNQSRELLGLFICMCIALCTIVAHNIAQNRPDSFPSSPPDNHHCSRKPEIVGEFDSCKGNVRELSQSQGSVREKFWLGQNCWLLIWHLGLHYCLVDCLRSLVSSV